MTSSWRKTNSDLKKIFDVVEPFLSDYILWCNCSFFIVLWMVNCIVGRCFFFFCYKCSCTWCSCNLRSAGTSISWLPSTFIIFLTSHSRGTSIMCKNFSLDKSLCSAWKVEFFKWVSHLHLCAAAPAWTTVTQGSYVFFFVLREGL